MLFAIPNKMQEDVWNAMYLARRKPIEGKWRIISIIAEKGYAEEVMVVAREAGAKGGTIINPHGTANEYDKIFCGIHLVPEKEILIMVAEEECVDAINEKVSEMTSLHEKGMCIPVSDFSILGCQ